MKTSAYCPEAPFENSIEHPLAPESCMVTMLYGACVQLGKIAVSEFSPKEFIDGAAEYAYKNGTWMHEGIGTYLRQFGVNFLSLDKRYLQHDLNRMVQVGRLNSPESVSLVQGCIEGTESAPLTVLSRRLKLLLGGYVLWGMKEGVNGYNGSVQPGAQHYLEFIENRPGVGSLVWDPDIRPHEDSGQLRPASIAPTGVAGQYWVSQDWLNLHSNGKIIAVWTDESREAVLKRAQYSPQIDAEVADASLRLLDQTAHMPLYPTRNDSGYDDAPCETSRMVYTYGANVKSRDGHSELDTFTSELGVQEVLLPRMGAHTGNVVVMKGDEVVAEPQTSVVHPMSLESNDGVIVIDPKCPILIPGADCPIYVGCAQLRDGRRVTFGAHSGQIGILKGLNETMVQKLSNLDLADGSVEILIGPGAHTIELALEYLEACDENIHSWRESVVRRYVGEDGREKVILNVVDCVLRSLNALGPKLRHAPEVVMSNTLTDKNVWSERAMTMHGLPPNKSNAVVVF